MKKYRNLVDINNKDECRGIRLNGPKICGWRDLLQMSADSYSGVRSIEQIVKVFRYSFSETSPMFFNRLKSDLSLSDRHKTFTSD